MRIVSGLEAEEGADWEEAGAMIAGFKLGLVLRRFNVEGYGPLVIERSG